MPFSTPDQDEGTRIHAYAAAVLKGIDPQDPDIPPELWEAAMGFVAYVQSVRAGIEGASIIEVEKTIPRAYAPGTCTPDVVLFDARKGNLHIIDLKAGIGVEVEAEKNFQLLLYAGSAMIAHGFDATFVSLHIYMPRHHSGEKRDVWTATGVQKSLVDMLNASQRILAAPFNQPFTPSDGACQFCPASSFCTARIAESTEELRVAEIRNIDLGNFAAVDDEKLAAMYRAIPAAKKYFAKLEAYVESRASSGVKFPGLKLVTGRLGNRHWSDDKKAFTLLRKLFPGESCRQIETISVTEADRLVKASAAVDPKLFAQLEKLIVRNEGSPTLVSETDPRPALTETIAASFDVVPKE